MFWTDWDRYGPKIEAANMDGTDRQVKENDIAGWDIKCVSSDPG